MKEDNAVHVTDEFLLQYHLDHLVRLSDMAHAKVDIISCSYQFHPVESMLKPNHQLEIWMF